MNNELYIIYYKNMYPINYTNILDILVDQVSNLPLQTDSNSINF